MGHIGGKVDVVVTWFEISRNFNSLGGVQGVENGVQNDV